ncbi:unnamed protein product [Cladocopium goreaui]|uniref:Uncharacterized protein n=1 Tax=Cladocopium goreaui TaxID=2562237 RepID=A0A9P1CTR0_9DINO|nr:unnamed protein product [Cladocopium goreaui]
MLVFLRRSFFLISLLVLLHPIAASLTEHDDLQAAEFVEISQVEVQEQVQRSENMCISMMLLGCMTFMMSNFYLVNHHDEDIRRISWEVISSTVSIFSAVLLFQACNKVLEYYVLEGMWIWYQLLVDMAHMLLWFVALQVVLAYLSGAMGEHIEVSSTRNSLNSASAATPIRRMARVDSANMHMEAVKINTVCWATLLGHVTGFAAINAWGTLQQAAPRILPCSFLVPALAFAGIFCIYQATEKLRKKWTDMDGEEDEFEKLWAEEVAETEDDVMSLAVSFLLVQALRFLISGHLPDTEGNDPPGLKQSNLSCELLFLAALAFGCFDVVQISVRKCFESGSNGQEDGDVADRVAGDVEATPASQTSRRSHSFNPLDKEHRWSTWGRDIFAMSTAWCLHFAVDWCLSANLNWDGALLAVLCALVVTFLAIIVIFVLDKLADMDFTDDEVDSSLRALIQSLGILIGFSWERSFDEAVGGLAEGHVLGLPPPVLTLLLALGLAGAVMPAWKWYILPVVESQKEETHKRHEEHIQAAVSSNELKLPLLKEETHERHEEHIQAAVSSNELKLPLLKDSSVQEDGRKKAEANSAVADLQKRLKAANQTIEDMKTKLAAKDLEGREAEKRYSELESALAIAKKGAIEEAKAMSQLQTELQEKEERLQEYVVKLKSSEDSVKTASDELARLRNLQGAAESALLHQAKVENADLGQKVSQLQEELIKVRAAAEQSKALGSLFEEKAKEEAGRSAKLEEQLRNCNSKLNELQAEKNAELDRMAAIATDTEFRLRQVQATAEEEQASSKVTASNLKVSLAKANEKADNTISQLAAIEKENQTLREEVTRLRASQSTPLMATAPAAPCRGHLTPQPGYGAGQWSAPFAAQEMRSPPVTVQRQASVPQSQQPQTFQPAAFASPALRLAQSAATPSTRPVQSVQQGYFPGIPDRDQGRLFVAQEPTRVTLCRGANSPGQFRHSATQGRPNM